MILNKALLIKGLVGTTSALGISAGAYFGKGHISELFRTNKGNDAPEPQVDQPKQESIVKKAGLTCTDENSTTGSDCTIDATKLKVDKDGTKTENISTATPTNGAKIKLQKLTDENTGGYNQGFKLSIEDGDISLTGGSNTTIKLEEFETYEIKAGENNDSDKYYLTRKDKSGKKIRELLGLPDGCSLPDSNTSTCTIASDKIDEIKFDGKSGNATNNSSSSLSLTITKVEDTDTDFSPYNYKFSFKTTNSGDITISKSAGSSISLKTNKGTEFKIKKNSTDNSLTLEEVWTLNKLLEKVGLSECTTTNQDCTIKDTGLNVKQEDNKKENNKKTDSAGTSGGKIKLHTSDATDYEHGFKFVIEDGDITLTGGTGSGTISKLEQFETYEIKKEENENKWFFSRKKDALEEKKRILGLPADESCKLPTGSETSTCCDLNADKLKTINFDGKGTDEPTIENSGTVTLTITKSSDSEFSDGGYKFSFQPTEKVTISTSSSIKIMKNTNTEFKIKKNGNTLTLEKAWTVAELAKQVGLTCPEPSNGDKKCSFTDGSINVDNGSNDKISKAKVKNSDNSSSKKMTYEEDQEGYNQGFKFFLDESEDLSLTNSTEGSADTAGDKKICNKGASGSEAYYEIKEESGTWYLTKKTTTVSK